MVIGIIFILCEVYCSNAQCHLLVLHIIKDNRCFWVSTNLEGFESGRSIEIPQILTRTCYTNTQMLIVPFPKDFPTFAVLGRKLKLKPFNVRANKGKEGNNAEFVYYTNGWRPKSLNHFIFKDGNQNGPFFFGRKIRTYVKLSECDGTEWHYAKVGSSIRNRLPNSHQMPGIRGGLKVPLTATLLLLSKKTLISNGSNGLDKELVQ